MSNTKIIVDSAGIIYAPVGRVGNGYVYNERNSIIGKYDREKVMVYSGNRIIGFAAGGAIMNPSGRQVARLNNSSEIESRKTLSPGEYAAVYNFFVKDIK